MMDGVFCDAEFHIGGPSTAAVVRVEAGLAVEIFTTVVEVIDSGEAELAAIALAREMFDGPVMNDCSGACYKTGAIWISRDDNRLAHRAARLRYLEELDRLGQQPSKNVIRQMKKLSKPRGIRGRKLRRGGRGVLQPGEANRFSVRNADERRG